VVAAGHDHELLSQLCDTALLLDGGMAAAHGPFDEVRTRYLGPGAEALTG
jgi:ABC-type polysaccharide/polyol phosphate transport system ATPase subunit